MSHEIEIKAYCHSHEEVKDKLSSMGAEFKETLIERDLYFNHPSRDFAQTDEAFRIRMCNEKVQITYKGPKIGKKVKARTEYETGIEDFDKARSIFNSLGFRESGIVSKKRDLYKLNDITIVLDSIEGLGDFVEIEKIGEVSDEIERELLDFAEKLNLNRFEKRSYLELLYYSGN